jgi:hypothetical protein
MRTRCLAIVSVLLAAVPLYGQTPPEGREFPRAEVFAGVSYLSTDSQAPIKRQNALGWGASAGWNFKDYLAVVAEGGGQYGHVNLPVTTPTAGGFSIIRKVAFSEYEFMGGPELSKRVREGRAFFHVLAGAMHARTPTVADLPSSVPIPFSFSQSLTRFAFAIGGGADRNISKGLAIRLFQVDFVRIQSSPPTSDFRAQGGIVWRFGK